VELEIIQQGVRLRDVVKKFQTVRLAFNEQMGFIRDVCFKSWKHVWIRGKRLRKLARRKGLRYRWNAWRTFLKCRKEREMDDYSNELDKKINRLVELNNLITNHSNETQGAGGGLSTPIRRSVISFGTASLIDPDMLPSPINTAISNVFTPVSLQNDNQPGRTFEQRKSMIENITRRVSRNFETVTITTTPTAATSMRRMVRNSQF
jgi:hypothetical protein